MLFHHLAEYETADRPLMIGRYGLDRGPGVLTVLAGTPAATAGLVAGDVLLSVNGRAFPSPARIAAEPKRKKWRPMLEASEKLLEDALRTGPAKLDVLRGGRRLDLTLGSEPGCIGRVRVAWSGQMNAFSLRGYVIMTTAMLGYVRGDDELAVVLGHELSHSILGHQGLRDEEGILAGLGINPNAIWKREAAADRLGLRLMAAAGYNLDAAIPFWNRYLGQYDWFPQIFRSHPSRGAREKIAREEIAAIRAGQPAPIR
jgi:Zn-dependent protease with chaperone function